MKVVILCFIGIILILALVWAGVLIKKENKEIEKSLITNIK
jgi:hypothetical protein